MISTSADGSAIAAPMHCIWYGQTVTGRWLVSATPFSVQAALGRLREAGSRGQRRVWIIVHVGEAAGD